MYRFKVRIIWEKQYKDGTIPSSALAYILATWKNTSSLRNAVKQHMLIDNNPEIGLEIKLGIFVS
jgi:predicted transposase YbfD/YdcC